MSVAQYGVCVREKFCCIWGTVNKAEICLWQSNWECECGIKAVMCMWYLAKLVCVCVWQLAKLGCEWP